MSSSTAAIEYLEHLTPLMNLFIFGFIFLVALLVINILANNIKKCPRYNSTRITKSKEGIQCKKCGYINKK